MSHAATTPAVPRVTSRMYDDYLYDLWRGETPILDVCLRRFVIAGDVSHRFYRSPANGARMVGFGPFFKSHLAAMDWFNEEGAGIAGEAAAGDAVLDQTV